MTHFNYSLDKSSYTLKNALLWGNFAGHCQEANKNWQAGRLGKWAVHSLIAAAQIIPIVSQIASLFERLIVTSCQQVNNNSPLPKRPQSASVPLMNQSHPTEPESLASWKTISADEVVNYHQRLSLNGQNYGNLMEWSRWAHGNIRPNARGLRSLASYLIHKHPLFLEDSIHICATMDEFKTGIEAMQQGGLRRCVFVVPSHTSKWWGKDREGRSVPRTGHLSQHIVAVAVEKTDEKLRIAILDPMARNGNEKITAENIGLDKDQNVPFTEQELILSHIANATLELETAEVFYSQVLREISNGCWVFALKDAVAFLQTPNFFEETTKGQEVVTFAKQQNRVFQATPITSLPWRFMKTFQGIPVNPCNELQLKIDKHRHNNHNLRIIRTSYKWMKMLQDQAHPV